MVWKLQLHANISNISKDYKVLLWTLVFTSTGLKFLNLHFSLICSSLSRNILRFRIINLPLDKILFSICTKNHQLFKNIYAVVSYDRLTIIQYMNKKFQKKLSSFVRRRIRNWQTTGWDMSSKPIVTNRHEKIPSSKFFRFYVVSFSSFLFHTLIEAFSFASFDSTNPMRCRRISRNLMKFYVCFFVWQIEKFQRSTKL